MKHILQLFVITTFIFQSQKVYSQHTDDTTFIGYWKIDDQNEIGKDIYKRSTKLDSENQGFHILDNETVRVQKVKDGNALIEFTGTWWSLQIGRIDIQYYDSTIKQMVIEGFQYLKTNDNSKIIRVRYEEYQRTEDSGFAGFWIKVNSNDPNEIIYERSEKVEANTDGFQLTEDEDLIRKILTNTKKNQYKDFEGIWWSFSEGQFDMQYYNSTKKRIIIEGFEFVKNSNQNRIIQTRYEEMKD